MSRLRAVRKNRDCYIDPRRIMGDSFLMREERAHTGHVELTPPPPAWPAPPQHSASGGKTQRLLLKFDRTHTFLFVYIVECVSLMAGLSSLAWPGSA